jgi:hypothetical protein
MLINRIIKWFIAWPDLLKYLGLISLTLAATYYAPYPIRVIWYVILLSSYLFSRNEALWLALFLSTTDGFAGFFGLYEATMTILPGLPAVEIAQIYIILTVIKAAGSRVKPVLFYSKYLQILFIYLLFTIVWGQLMGLSGGLNVYFRLLKGFIPMLLFYSVPRLFVKWEMYERFFNLVFYIVLIAFAAQLFTLFTGISPMEAGGISRSDENEDVNEFRVFYNSSTALIGMFGGLYFIARRVRKDAGRFLPFAVVFSSLAMALLSATRGWIISFSLVTLLALMFTGIAGSRRFILFVIVIIPVILWALSSPTISSQLEFARERLETIGAISEGDLTARGTLQRLDYRSQKALSGWKENPLFGWGLSDMGYSYNDGHVGNQSLLAISGVVGFALLNGFLIWFSYMIVALYLKSAKKKVDRNPLLIFVIFLIGWFFIHSSSGQQFGYSGIPEQIIPQAVFFSFGAYRYQRILSIVNGKKI